jgi:hypothetical protein
VSSRRLSSCCRFADMSTETERWRAVPAHPG